MKRRILIQKKNNSTNTIKDHNKFFLVRQGGTEGNLRNSCSIPVLQMKILIYHPVRIKFLNLLYIYIYKRLKWFVKQHPSTQNKVIKN